MDRVLRALLRRGALKYRSQLSAVRCSSQLSTSYCRSYSPEKLSRGSHNCRSLIWRADDVTFSSICRRGFASDGGDSGDVVVPFMGDSISEGSVATLLKQPGETVEVDDIVAQVETEKVTIDVRTTVAGTVDKVLVKVGDKVVPGAKVAFIAKGQSSGKPAAPTQEKKEAPPPPSAPSPLPPSPPTPSPKAQEKPVPAPKPVGAGSAEPQKDMKTRLERRVPMTTLRKRIADRLRFSQDTFVQLTTFNEIDMTNLMALRAQYKDAFAEKHGAKLGFLSGFVKATVSALQQQPIVNAVIDGDDIVHRDYIDISIAVATPKGLLVPVVRGAAGMNFAEIEKTISMLAKKANDGKISIDDMAGGTFTISNGGVYGSLCSTPIINPPQSAILGLHAIQKRPVVIGDSIVARPMMQVALTYDHRLIDGREAVLFLRRVKDVVEDPTRLILDV